MRMLGGSPTEYSYTSVMHTIYTVVNYGGINQSIYMVKNQFQLEGVDDGHQRIKGLTGKKVT